MSILILQGFFVPPTLDEWEEQLAHDCLQSFMRDFYARIGLTPPN